MAGSNSSKRRGIRDGIGRRLLLLAAASISAGALGAQEAPLQQEQPLRVTVNRVSVGVTVSDSHGKFVSGLSKKDFRVFDNGVEQPIADFLSVEEPAQFLLLIESGPPVFLFSKNHILAADSLLSSVAPEDRVALATYSRGPNLVLDFTADKGTARLALRSIDFRSGFGELDLFSTISAAIGKLAPLAGKKTIVLLSTGLDTSSNVDWQSLLPKLQVSDVRIISVSLAGDIRKPAKKGKLTPEEKNARTELKKGFAEADGSLRGLANATGGRVYFAKDAKDFKKAYAEIAELLRHEYSIAFAPTAFDGKVHTLRVEVKKRGVRVDHRPAYLAAAATGTGPAVK